MPRKTDGCWTCRARKKRCDAQRPACAACTTRSITCYGYNGKPSWMDNGKIEKEVMQLLHQQIKRSYSLRRTRASRWDLLLDNSTRSNGSCRPVAATSPLELIFNGSLSSLNREAQTIVLESHSPVDPYHSHPTPEGALSLTPSDEVNSRCSHDERDLDLLMYYFDHIHPRQFPFHRSTPSDIGRGWLLNLHLRTKPLCTATACLSACDQAQFALGPLTNVPQPYEELEQQHVESLADLRDHLDLLSKKSGVSHIAATVEALACIIQLICFELWIPRKGMDGDWGMHLEAAGALLSTLDDISDYEIPWWEVNSDVSERPELSSLSSGEKAAYKIFLTTYTWYFIIASATVGLSPKSARSILRTRALFHPHQTKLRDMMGCEDWVMITILDIAVLEDWKKEMKCCGTLSLRELARRADAIEAKLNGGLDILLTSKSSCDSETGRVKCMVTEIFIYAAITYLHIVVSGFYPELPELHYSVVRTLEAMEAMKDPSYIRYVTWPFGIAGSMALDSEKDRFRALVPKQKVGEHPLVMCLWTMNFVETCWAMRMAQPKGKEACDLISAMNHTGTRLLLL